MTNATPPARADALLQGTLPPGLKGLTIRADLNLEFADMIRARGERAAARWYWKEAVGLTLHYGVRRGVGALTKRDGRGWEMMTTALSDLRFGLRMLLKTPGLSLVAVLTIALGVGLTTHTYSTVYGSIIRGLPVPGADRLMHVYEDDTRRGIEQGGTPIRDYLDLRERQTSYEDLAGFFQTTVNLAGDDAPPERFPGLRVSARALDLVGIQPMLGRSFRDGEDGPDASPVAVLSYQLWQSRFAGNPGIIGRFIRANGESTEIVGVMPEGFEFPFDSQIWLPYHLDPNPLDRRSSWVDVVGRLREGVSQEAASAELAAISAELARTFPDDNEGIVLGQQPFDERYMPAQIAAVFFLMLAATFGVLLIACANVANLLLARASMRTREVAIRTAMGASRARVIRQLMAEALVLAVIGGALGVGLAYIGIDAFNASIAGIRKPYWIDIGIDGTALTFALGVTLLASVAAGTIPALRASGFGVGEILKDANRGSSSLRLGRFGTSLVIGEIAVSCGLLIAAGLMIKSISNLRNTDLGFEPASVLVGRVGLVEADYPERGDRAPFFERLQARLASEPGVESVALANSTPALGANRWSMGVEGESYPADIDYPIVNGNVVTAGFFETVGVRPVLGRAFTQTEVWDESDPVAIVNESFVRRLLDGRNPIGQRVRIGRADSEWPYARIVGVVPDMYVGGGVGGIGDDQIAREQLYLTPATVDVGFMTVLLRTSGPPAALAPTLRRVVSELDPNLPVYDLAPMSEAIQQSTWAFGLFGSLFTIFGVAALFMAAVGLYGVMAFSVSQRKREMGVRMALGAGPDAILRMVLRRGAVQLAIGTGIGLVLGYGMSKPLAFVTYGVDAFDPVVYVAIVGTLGAAGLVACILPARRATRTDPVEAMRLE
jgi:putative ABC transport system permease protein